MASSFLHCTVYGTHSPLYCRQFDKRKGTCVMWADISISEKVWDVLYASVMLEGEERREALRRLGVPCPEGAHSASV